MTRYAAPLDKRFSQQMTDMMRRLRKVESRTIAIDSGMPLAALPAVIDPAYSSGDPKAFINGSTTLTGPYQHLSSYTPAANDAVLVIPTPVTAASVSSYVVLGKLS